MSLKGMSKGITDGMVRIAACSEKTKGLFQWMKRKTELYYEYVPVHCLLFSSAGLRSEGLSTLRGS